MGLRGPPPQPTRLRVLSGNPGRRPINRREPQPIGEPERPDFVGAEEWDRIIASMPPGFFSAADTPVLAVLCSALAMHHAAFAEVTADGLDAHGGTHPLIAVMARQAEIVLKASDRLGLSPSARTRLTVPERSSGKFIGLIGPEGPAA